MFKWVGLYSMGLVEGVTCSGGIMVLLPDGCKRMCLSPRQILFLDPDLCTEHNTTPRNTSQDASQQPKITVMQQHMLLFIHPLLFF